MTMNIIFRVPIIVLYNNIEMSDNINNVILKSTSHNIFRYILICISHLLFIVNTIGNTIGTL